MRLTVVSLFAVGLLVAACGTDPQASSATTGGGTGASTGSTAAAAQPLTTESVSGPSAGSQEHLLVNVGDRVFFGYDRSDLEPQSQQTVEALAAWLKTYPAVILTIEGHADERGTREYNLALGERRASSIRDYLIALGIDPNRLTTISYGKERPAVLGSNEQAWGQNRRGVFVSG